MRTSPGFPLAAAIGAVLLATGVAHADDVVFLKNGGRVRGAVMSESPTDGVKMKLADGRIRNILARDVERIEYEDQPGAAPPPPASPPAALPPAVLPPAPPPARKGILTVVSSEPSTVYLDEVALGKGVLVKEMVPVGEHRVRVRYDLGGEGESTVFIKEAEPVDVVFEVSEKEKMFRPRRGASLGISIDGVFIYPTGAPTPYGGVRGSLLLNLGLHPILDVRAGAFATAALGDLNGLSIIAPMGGFFNFTFHGSSVFGAVGLQGGYAPLTLPNSPYWRPDTLHLGLIGPQFAVGLRLGADRRWELGLRQELSGLVGETVGIDVVSTTSIGFTYLFLQGTAARARR